MCILFFVLNENAKGDGEYKLILASNRDEFYARPAQVAGPWEEDEFIIGGRDMEPGEAHYFHIQIKYHLICSHCVDF